MRVSYKAYNPSGDLVRGEIEAHSLADALSELRREKRLIPFEAFEAIKTQKSGQGIWQRDFSLSDLSFSGLSLSNRATLLKMLSALLEAGIPLDRSLRVLESGHLNAGISRTASQSAEGVSSGKAFSSTIEDCGFGPEELGLIRAGEHTGHLAATLVELVGLLEHRISTRAKIASAMVYPAVLVAMALASMVVIATVLVPTLVPLFDQSGARLPFIVSVMIGARSLFVGIGWWFLALACALAALGFAILRQPAVKTALQRIVYLSRIARVQEAARICRTLGILLRNGVALQSALRLTIDVAHSELTRQQIRMATERVVSGVRLNKAFEVVGVMDKQALQMIAIGEETNRLDALLLYLATSFESFATTRIERMTTLLTPVLTVMLGAFVGTLIMSVMQAILSLNDLALK